MKKMETVLTELYFFVIFFCFFYKKTEKVLDKVVEIRMINQSINQSVNQSININSILIPFLAAGVPERGYVWPQQFLLAWNCREGCLRPFCV